MDLSELNKQLSDSLNFVFDALQDVDASINSLGVEDAVEDGDVEGGVSAESEGSERVSTLQAKYIDYVNDNIAPNIDLAKLQASYDGDWKYAEKLLRKLHDAVTVCYGTSEFDRHACEDSEGFVTLPGIVRGDKTGKMAVALLDFDLTSSAEFYGGYFFLGCGVVNDCDGNGTTPPIVKKDFTPYTYGYTPFIEDDHHVEYEKLPSEMRRILDKF